MHHVLMVVCLRLTSVENGRGGAIAATSEFNQSQSCFQSPFIQAGGERERSIGRSTARRLATDTPCCSTRHWPAPQWTTRRRAAPLPCRLPPVRRSALHSARPSAAAAPRVGRSIEHWHCHHMFKHRRSRRASLASLTYHRFGVAQRCTARALLPHQSSVAHRAQYLHPSKDKRLMTHWTEQKEK
jgi:hypothetical protein